MAATGVILSQGTVERETHNLAIPELEFILVSRLLLRRGLAFYSRLDTMLLPMEA